MIPRDPLIVISVCCVPLEISKAISSLPSLSHALGEVMLQGLATSHIAPNEEGKGERVMLQGLAISESNAPRLGHLREQCSKAWPPQRAMLQGLATSESNAPRLGHLRAREQCSKAWPPQRAMLQGLATSHNYNYYST